MAMLSVVATGVSGTSIKELAAWVAATAIVVPVRFLPSAARTTMVRIFVISAAAAAALGIVLVRIDPDGVLFERLTIAGYRERRSNVQQVGGSEDIATRLTGTFVEPNIAGLILVAAVLLAVAYFRGPLRVALVVLLGAGLLLTLSRAAMATVVLAGVLLVLRTPGRRRLPIIMAGLVAALGSLAIPGVLGRLLDSFGPSDTGTIARDLALQEFPRAMEGHWIWGLGWDRDEFRLASVGRVVNYVANGPAGDDLPRRRDPRHPGRGGADRPGRSLVDRRRTTRSRTPSCAAVSSDSCWWRSSSTSRSSSRHRPRPCSRSSSDCR